MITRCSNVAPPSEYWLLASRCELEDGHEGPHAAHASKRMWSDMSFKMNFMEDCRVCGKPTSGFDERGPLCIDCAVVKAMKEGV